MIDAAPAGTHRVRVIMVVGDESNSIQPRSSHLSLAEMRRASRHWILRRLFPQLMF